MCVQQNTAFHNMHSLNFELRGFRQCLLVVYGTMVCMVQGILFRIEATVTRCNAMPC